LVLEVGDKLVRSLFRCRLENLLPLSNQALQVLAFALCHAMWWVLRHFKCSWISGTFLFMLVDRATLVSLMIEPVISRTPASSSIGIGFAHR
jgi:hypothetical protein